ncbi:hypothetical protein Tco_1532852 [Tanacetum coccineum]
MEWMVEPTALRLLIPVLPIMMLYGELHFTITNSISTSLAPSESRPDADIKVRSSIMLDLPSSKGLLRLPSTLIKFMTFTPRWCCGLCPHGSHRTYSSFAFWEFRSKAVVLGSLRFPWRGFLSESWSSGPQARMNIFL